MVLVSSRAEGNRVIVDSLLLKGLGFAIRPRGASGTTTICAGDVPRRGHDAGGRLLACNRTSGRFIDDMHAGKGCPIEVEGFWSLIFGNHVRRGDTNLLDIAAGPNPELDGLFGKLVPLVPW